MCVCVCMDVREKERTSGSQSPHLYKGYVTAPTCAEENSRMGKTRDLFNKTRDTKGTFHAKMGSIKDRNGMDLTEAEDIKKRWQEYKRTVQENS